MEVLNNLLEENQVLQTDDVKDENLMNRPATKIELKAIINKDGDLLQDSKGPTSDLVTLPFGKCTGYQKQLEKIGAGYIIYDKDSMDTWYAHDEVCLNKNFIYRDDLEITEISNNAEGVAIWEQYNENVKYGSATSKIKYILVDPMSENYEVYCNGDYTSQKYGKVIPTGRYTLRFKNRFHRDIGIMQLEEKFSSSSRKEAANFVSKDFGEDEAYIISDGSQSKESSVYCYYYMDKDVLLKQSRCAKPSNDKQATIIAEISGAYYALKQCYENQKRTITYYYDNNAIVNVFKTNRNDAIPEISAYKDLVVKMNEEGYSLNFVELHPKRGQNRDSDNKALTYFHNMCDDECKILVDVFDRNYKYHAQKDRQVGLSASEICNKRSKSRAYNNKNYKQQGKQTGSPNLGMHKERNSFDSSRYEYAGSAKNNSNNKNYRR